jgi:D-serine dehydratase
MSNTNPDASVMNDFIESILATPLDSRSKGMPATDRQIPLGDVGTKGWNVLRGDMMLPLLTVNQTRMHKNLALMREYADHHNVSLAPHGKSTVCPQLYLEQIGMGGCWGITAATIQQAAVVAATGITNVIIANQVVSRANVEQFVDLKKKYPAAAIYSLVDSPETVRQLAEFGRTRLSGAKFQVLAEVGYVGGRTGARTFESAKAVIDEIGHQSDVIELCGVECYEGTINLADPDETIAEVDRFLDFAVSVLAYCKNSGLLRKDGEVLLTAGGSAYFDRVVSKFTAAHSGPNARIVLRGGSYLTYDHGFYEKKLLQLDERGGLDGPRGHIRASTEFLPALQIWAAVQSLQDPGMAILAMGIRDLPYDLGYPRPLRQYRNGKEIRNLEADGAPYKIINSNDQHCYMQYPAGTDIAVGDVLACGISHPCTAFDKWDVFYMIDDDHNVIGALKTFF